MMSVVARRGDGHFVNRFAVGSNRTARGAAQFRALSLIFSMEGWMCGERA
jgi:hypothetical protein